MATRTGYIKQPIVASVGSPGVQAIHCTYSGVLNNGDVIQFGDNIQNYLPAGCEFTGGGRLYVTEASSALSAEIGYAAIDGASGTTNGVADVNATALLTATSVGGAANTRTSFNGVKEGPVLQRDSYITLTATSGAVGSEAVFDIWVEYVFQNTLVPTVVY